MVTGVSFKMLPSRAKLTSFACCSSMGAIFLLQYSLFNQYLCRVDARATTNKEGRSPIEIAQNKGFTEIVVLLSESIGKEPPLPVKMQIMVEAMSKGDFEEFSKILETLSPELVGFQRLSFLLISVLFR